MRKDQKIALALAGVIALSTFSGCSKKTTESIVESTNVEEKIDQYKVDDLYVVFSKTITGEKCLHIIIKKNDWLDLSYYDALNNYSFLYKKIININTNSNVKSIELFEYLNLDEMKEYVTKDELKSIYARLQLEYNTFNDKVVFSETSSNDEEPLYNVESLYIVEAKKNKDGEKELYIRDKYGIEIFTKKDLNCFSSYNLIDYLDLDDYKEKYTESELKEILSFVRERYHSKNVDSSLKLTK